MYCASEDKHESNQIVTLTAFHCCKVTVKAQFPKTKVMPYKGGQGQRSKEVYGKLKGEICLRHLFTC